MFRFSPEKPRIVEKEKIGKDDMFQAGHLSLQPEQREHKKLNIEVGFLYGCNSVKEVPELLEESLKEGPLDTVMFNEYTFKLEEILDNKENLTSLAKEKKVNFIMTPDNRFEEGINWGKTKEKFQQSSIPFEENDISDDFKPEAIGFYFNREGVIYAFPKVWKKNPVHRIPNTNIGITICGELHDIRAEDIKDIDILYNPSREGDDPHLQKRLKLARQYKEQGKITKEMVEKLFSEHYSRLLLPDKEYRELFKDASKEFIEDFVTHETETKRKEHFNEYVDSFWKEIKGGPESNFDSPYTREIGKILKEKSVPIVRCDGRKCSGPLNLSSGVEVDNMIFKEKFGRMHILQNNKK